MEDKNDKLNCQNSEEVEFKTEHIDESAEVKATEQSEESLETDPLSNMTFADDNEDNEYGYDGDYFEDDREKKKKHKKENSGGYAKPIIFVCSILIFSFLLAGGIIMTAIEVMGIRTTDEVIQVTIPKGSSNQAISQILKEKRIIKFPFLFRFVAKNEEEPFNYGIFTLKPGMSYSEIFHNLQQKTDVEGAMNFTIIEGDNLYSIAKKLEKKGICTAEGFVKVANSSSFGYSFEKSIETNPLKFSRVEGYLFPDTYRVYKGQDTEEIVNVIFGNFDSKITPELYDRMNEMGMTLEQTLTLASIIQGEAGDPNEMAKVSGVFHNRIKNPTEFPKLESDVTKKYVEKVIKPNSETNNPDMNYAYNTYDGNGLPPGPVCNPGLDAIKAALYPQQSDYYFFCSDIKTRKFYYAKTLPEHVANLDKAGLR